MANPPIIEPYPQPTADEVTAELRDVFTPLCVATAEAAQPEKLDLELYEKAQQLIRHELPYGDIYGKRPWDSLLSASPGLVRNVLKHHYEHPIDEATWRAYESYVLDLSPVERANIEALQSYRGDNFHERFDSFRGTAQADSFLCTKNREIVDNRYTTNVVVPIGQYGTGFAETLLQTTLVMQVIAQQQLTLAKQLTNEHEATLRVYTARANQEGIASPDTTMLTLQEGVLSVMQSIAQLTMEKVEGYDEPVELVKDLVKGGLVERMTRYAPMAFVGPLTLRGKYFPGALARAEDGIKFSHEFEAYLKLRRIFYLGFVASQQAKIASGSHGYEEYRYLGTVCPVAGSGIPALATSFSKLLSLNSI